MWTILRDVLVVPSLLWVNPPSGADGRLHWSSGSAEAHCADERRAVKAHFAPRPSSEVASPTLRRQSAALYP